MATLLISIPGAPDGGADLPQLPYALTPITSDTFTGGNDSDIDGRTTDAELGGSGLAWGATANGFAIASGALAKGSSSSISAAALNVGSGDVRVSVVFSALPSNLFMDFRKTAAGSVASIVNCYRLRVQSSGAVELQRNKGGSAGTVISVGSHTASAGDTIAAQIIGNQLAIVINDQVVEYVNDADPVVGPYVEIYRGGTATFTMVSIRVDTPS